MVGRPKFIAQLWCYVPQTSDYIVSDKAQQFPKFFPPFCNSTCLLKVMVFVENRVLAFGGIKTNYFKSDIGEPLEYLVFFFVIQLVTKCVSKN